MEEVLRPPQVTFQAPVRYRSLRTGSRPVPEVARGLAPAGKLVFCLSAQRALGWDCSSHEPLGGQIPAVLPRPAGLSQGTGGAAAQPGEQTGEGGGRQGRT